MNAKGNAFIFVRSSFCKQILSEDLHINETHKIYLIKIKCCTHLVPMVTSKAFWEPSNLQNWHATQAMKSDGSALMKNVSMMLCAVMTTFVKIAK